MNYEELKELISEILHCRVTDSDINLMLQRANIKRKEEITSYEIKQVIDSLVGIKTTFPDYMFLINNLVFKSLNTSDVATIIRNFQRLLDIDLPCFFKPTEHLSSPIWDKVFVGVELLYLNGKISTKDVENSMKVLKRELKRST